MPAFNKFQATVLHLASGVHQLQTGSSHVCKVYLASAVPDAAADAVKADLAEISAGSGYAAGGATCTLTSGAQTGGTFKLTLADPPTWTATGGSIGPFRYAVLYNDTPTSPADPLLGWWDYGSSLTLASGETFTVDLDQTGGTLTLT
jgi:hypothetical protein